MKRASWYNKILFYFSLNLIAVVTISTQAFSQSDSAVSFPLITINYGFQIPGGDLAQRFGVNSTFGIGIFHKLKSNFIYGLQWNYMFSNKVKEDSVFKGILTPEGTIIDEDGKNGAYKVMERGHLFSLSFGYLINTKQNKNSGIVTMLSLVGLQHKIRIHNNSNNIPQINNEYKQGYDHLTNGLGVGLFLGYMYLSEKNYLNIYGGFDTSVGFTKNRRYNFNTSSIDNNLRYDIISGIKIGIILPLYSRNNDGKFYYD
jgi:hypothetical protein